MSRMLYQAELLRQNLIIFSKTAESGFSPAFIIGGHSHRKNLLVVETTDLSGIKPPSFYFSGEAPPNISPGWLTPP